jgi:magnesium transporter
MRSPLAATGLTIVVDDISSSDGTRAAVPEAVRVEAALSGSRETSTISAWLFSPDHDPTEVALADLAPLVADDAHFLWVDLSAHADPELRQIATPLDLHPNAVRAALAPWQRPRLSVYSDHFFVSATVARPSLRTFRVQAAELDLFVGRNVLVSAHRQPLPFADHLAARARHSADLVARDAAYTLYIVLDELLAYYEELDRQQQAEVERIEERALHESSDAFLADLVRFKRHAFALAQLAEQHRELLAAFLRPGFGWVAGAAVEEPFRDLQARLWHLLDALHGAREAANGALDIHVSHVAHRTNQVIKVLTMASIVLFIASVLIALAGVTLQGALLSYGPAGLLAFLCLLLTVGLVSAATLLAFRGRGWL